MKEKNIFLISLVSIILVVILTISGTYAVVINVVNEEGIDKIVNEITVRDLVTNDDGTFNNNYYNARNELGITDAEASTIINSRYLNESLKTVLDSIVKYKLHNDLDARLSNDEIYNMIIDAVNKTDTITPEVKSKVKNKASYYKQDIGDFIYDIEVSLVGGK